MFNIYVTTKNYKAHKVYQRHWMNTVTPPKGTHNNVDGINTILVYDI